MVCRHSPGDPNCSSSPAGAQRAASAAIERAEQKAKQKIAEYEAKTPDAEKFLIDEVEQVGLHLVMRVKYPNCAKCEYEGNKVMVFLGVDLKTVLKWRRIDPHFRRPVPPPLASEAPGPAARFPASEQGWRDALEYAERKTKK